MKVLPICLHKKKTNLPRTKVELLSLISLHGVVVCMREPRALKFHEEGSSLGLCLSFLSLCLYMEMFVSLHSVVSSHESHGELHILETI